MTEETKEKVVKKSRRGVSNETRATSLLKFHERDAVPTGKGAGLFIGHLEEILVDYRTLQEDTKGLQSFAGKAIPRLTMHFCSNHDKTNERRHVYQTILPVESNIDTIPGGSSEWQVNNVFAWIKHILDVYYLRGRDLTESEADALTLSFEDFDDEGTYVPVDADDVLNGYKILFENVVAMMNGTWNIAEGETPKCRYRTDKGGFIPAYLKLLRYKKVKGEWRSVGTNGDLAFDNFIGEGVVELVKAQNPPTILHLNIATESITPKETKKAPTVGGANGVPGMPGMGGVIPGLDMGADNNSAFADASADMPF